MYLRRQFYVNTSLLFVIQWECGVLLRCGEASVWSW